MKVHIGELIKASMIKKGINATKFASKISYSRRNLYDIFSKPSIDTSVLVRINKVLGENLFVHYISDKEVKSRHSRILASEELRVLIKQLSLKLKLVDLEESAKRRIALKKTIKKTKA